MNDDLKRRSFLQTMGALPTLATVPEGPEQTASAPSSKFTPLDLSAYFNAVPSALGPREQVRRGGYADDLFRFPGGARTLVGVPFLLGPEGVNAKSWILLGARGATVGEPVEVPIGKRAAYVCLAQFCDWDQTAPAAPDLDWIDRTGQRLADAALLFENGEDHSVPMRRRIELGDLGSVRGAGFVPRKLTDPLRNAKEWGGLQTTVGYQSGGHPVLSVFALENPKPEQPIKALRLSAASDDAVIVCGITLYHGPGHPLRYERLTTYRITLPEAAAGSADRWKADLDLGSVARVYSLPEFRAEEWLASPRVGRGNLPQRATDGRYLYVEVTASEGATLTLRDTKAGQAYEFDLADAARGREVGGKPARASIQWIEPQRIWLHARVLDGVTKQPTPVRLAFRSKEGRYLPPYGHRTEVNDGWFQDYGADLNIAGCHFAYVDGTFQVELPVGEVYLEMTKGYEYEGVRKKLTIAPGQRDLTLEIPRFADLRSRGWIAADTHVHFLSPPTAVLEGQAEGLNLVNLLAAQWGDMFSNVGDLSYEQPLKSADGDTMVRVGTENRQHLLGHISLLGGRGEPVFPMSAGGPEESYIGDPVWSSMSEWADRCRKREGVVVSPHFPWPNAELPAEIVLGKLDAVEIAAAQQTITQGQFLEWYRYLNCGYRVTVVGGTDKMGAGVAVGASRTFAFIGKGEEFSFANWAKAVRRGNTFTSTGPLLLFQADGRVPGDEIVLGAGGGTIELKVEARSNAPFHRLEVVRNGRPIASRDAPDGVRELVLEEKVRVSGPGWLAARCWAKPVAVGRMAGALGAHTSPIYLKVPGQDLFSAPVALYLLSLIEGTQYWLNNLATRTDAERWQRVKAVFEEAHTHLHKRMRDHGIHV